MIKTLRRATLLIIILTLSGCASIDFEAPKSESYVDHETENTYLAQQVRDHVLLHPGQAGFYPIYDGVDSLALRLLIAERAEKTLDAQ